MPDQILSGQVHGGCAAMRVDAKTERMAGTLLVIVGKIDRAEICRMTGMPMGRVSIARVCMSRRVRMD